MKRSPKSSVETPPLLVFGAHPDDIEFGCGGIIARESQGGRAVHLVVCSRGEAATHGTSAQRTAEARKAAALLGASLEFAELDGDAQLEVRAKHALRLAAIIRRVRPGIIFAPSLSENQHPDHPKLGRIVRDAARLARYGGLAGLRGRPAHSIGQLFFYAVSPGAEPGGIQPILIDVSAPSVLKAWTAAMQAHATQMRTRDYLDLQLCRARLHGLAAGASHAQPLYPADPPIFNSLAPLGRGARQF
jgi:LmbE family N-acetylglucosaminyl deacetylase